MLVNVTFVPVAVGEKTYTPTLPRKGSTEAAAFDVSTPYPFEIKVGEKHLVNTGLVIKIPRGYCVQILPRSGLACKRGITIPNAPGLIDRDYCGPEDIVKVMLVNQGDEDAEFVEGDRIAQMLFVPYLSPDMNLVGETEGKQSRGGFGSTGLNAKTNS